MRSVSKTVRSMSETATDDISEDVVSFMLLMSEILSVDVTVTMLLVVDNNTALTVMVVGRCSSAQGVG